MKNNMKKQRRISTQLFTAFLLITTIMMVIMWIFLINSLQDFHQKSKITDLESRAMLVGASLSLLQNKDHSHIQGLCEDLSAKSSMRITVIGADGVVLVDTEEDPASMDNHADRPEIRTAVTGETGHSVRYSYTVNRDMLYVAIPLIFDNNKVTLRVSLPLEGLNDSIAGFSFKILMAIVLLTGLALLASYHLSKRVTEPLEIMRRQAKKYASGKFKYKIPHAQSREMDSLGQSLNLMAEQLDDRIQTILQQKEEQEAILSAMMESVFALNTEGALITINAAASALFHLEPDACLGRKYYEVIRNSELLKFIETIYKGGDVHETDIEIINSREKHLKVHGTTLRDPHGNISGIVIVLNDISQIRYLEQVRKEFVSNVSHELKTPVTAIQGYVETLKEVREPEEMSQFLSIIQRHTDRLNAIIDDLLELSRLEEHGEKGLIEFGLYPLEPVIQDALKDCQEKAGEKGVALQTICDDSVKLQMNRSLIREALINLLNNAIRYSKSGEKVVVQAAIRGREILISVTDTGTGIPAKHLDRIFERFYRVEQARTRSNGGTGLGLAIVKHIARVHKGSVSVTSELEKGSCFTIHLPK